MSDRLTETLSICFSPKDRILLSEEAEKQNRTPSSLVRAVMREYIREQAIREVKKEIE